jgi:hypothetical protein
MLIALVRLKDFKLYEFSSTHPIIKVNAQDPDDACFLAMKKLFDIVLDQDPSIETKLLLKDVKHDIRILKIL